MHSNGDDDDAPLPPPRRFTGARAAALAAASAVSAAPPAESREIVEVKSKSTAAASSASSAVPRRFVRQQVRRLLSLFCRYDEKIESCCRLCGETKRINPEEAKREKKNLDLNLFLFLFLSFQPPRRSPTTSSTTPNWRKRSLGYLQITTSRSPKRSGGSERSRRNALPCSSPKAC